MVIVTETDNMQSLLKRVAGEGWCDHTDPPPARWRTRPARAYDTGTGRAVAAAGLVVATGVGEVPPGRSHAETPVDAL